MSANAEFETEQWLKYEPTRRKREQRSLAQIPSVHVDRPGPVTMIVMITRESIGTMLIGLGGRIRPTPPTPRSQPAAPA